MVESIVNNAKKTATPSGSNFGMENGSWKTEQSLIITSEAVAANAVPLQLYQPTALLRTDLLGRRPSNFAVNNDNRRNTGRLRKWCFMRVIC